MNRKKFYLFFLVPALIAATGFLNSCGDETDASDLESFSVDRKTEKPTNVEVMPLKPVSFVENIEVPGEIKADIASTISAEEAGKVIQIRFKKGAKVRKGNVLIELDSNVLQKSFEEARAAFESAKTRFERQKNLYQQNAISEQQYLDTKFAFDRAKAAMEVLQARLEKMHITSPINGILDNRFVDLGEFVSPGKPVAEVIKIDVVKVAAGVPERYITDINLNSPVQARIDLLGKQKFAGQITFIGSTIHPSSRTFPVEVKIENPKGLIKPNMLARLFIVRHQFKNGIVVPRDALVETEKGKMVFVAANNQAEARNVAIVAASENQVLIQGNIRFGDLLIVRGHRELVNGEHIAIQNAE